MEEKKILKITEEMSSATLRIGNCVKEIPIRTIDTFFEDGSKDCKIVIPKLNLKSKTVKGK